MAKITKKIYLLYRQGVFKRGAIWKIKSSYWDFEEGDTNFLVKKLMVRFKLTFCAQKNPCVLTTESRQHLENFLKLAQFR